MSATVFVCGQPSKWSRCVARCPICKTKRRMIHAVVFGGYGSDLICGGCGSINQDMDGFRRLGKRDSEANREKVRCEWPAARTRAEERAELHAMWDAEAEAYK